MVSIVRVTTAGNNKLVHLDDGSSRMAIPDGRGSWIMKPFVLGEDGGPPPVDPGDGGNVGPVPSSLRTTAVNGAVYNFNTVNLTHAKKLIEASKKISGGNTQQVLRIVLITAIVESAGLWMYSNTRAYPETANYPHDRDGTDHDSVGMYQQRPSTGWGTPKQCMDHDYSTASFLGQNRNRGLFDIANWQSMSPGQAAQKVQVSAFPSRYDNVMPCANDIMKALGV